MVESDPSLRSVVISTEGQVVEELKPKPDFIAPNDFIDLTGVHYHLGGRLTKAYHRDYISYLYFIPNEEMAEGRQQHRIFPETYVKNVLEIQAKEAERRNGNGA